MTKPSGEVPAASRTSVAALVTYWLLIIWTITVLCAFGLVLRGVDIKATALGLLSGIIGTETTLLVASVSFWVGSTVGNKALGDTIASAGARAQETLAGLATTAGPLAGTTTTTTTTAAPTPVVVTNDPAAPVPVAETPQPFMDRPVP